MFAQFVCWALLLGALLFCADPVGAQDLNARFYMQPSQEYPGAWVGVICNDDSDPVVAVWLEGITVPVSLTNWPYGWDFAEDGSGGIGWSTEGEGIAGSCSAWSFAIWTPASGQAAVQYIVVADSGNFYVGWVDMASW